MQQKNVFMAREGNEWYERNKAAILEKSLANDPIFKALEYLGSKPARSLEIGCANGWRLALLASHYGAQNHEGIPLPVPYKTLTMVNVSSI